MTLSRRRFLETLGAGSIALSCLKTSRLMAQNAPLPKRLIVIFTPNGTIPEAWGADGDRTNFTLRPILADLAPHKDQLVVLQGVDMLSAYSGPGDGHQQGMGHLLTGVELLPGDIKGGCEDCPAASFPSDISVDQAIANHLGNDTRFRSLELGVLVSGGENTWNRMSSRGPGQPLPPESDPSRVFDRVFADLSADPFGLAQKRALKKSVLDYVYRDFTAVKNRVSSEERQRIELHETTLRDIERRLQNPGTIGVTCRAPDRPEKLDVRSHDNAPALGKLQMDLMVMALACDLTRVASLMWTNSVGQLSFPWLGINDRQHDLSHEGDSNLIARDKLVKMNTWYSQQFKYLLDRLAETPEGDGFLIDNTLVLWGNELGVGNSHTRNNVPFLLAGGPIRKGQFLTFDKRPHNDLLLSVCHALGLSRSTFGDVRFNTGPISEILR